MRPLFLIISLLAISCNNRTSEDELRQEQAHVDSLSGYAGPQSEASQDPETKRMVDTIRPKFADVHVWYEDGTASHGSGMILAGKYLATDYHVIHNPPGKKIIKSIIWYNYRTKGKGMAADSVSLDLSYKPHAGQFDFSKLKYDSTDSRTDFIVLKLAHKVPTTYYNFSALDDLSKSDTVAYCVGYHIVDSVERRSFRKLQILEPVNFGNKGFDFVACLGETYQGFSGTPVYKENGQVVGIAEFVYDDTSKIPEAFRSRPYWPKIEAGYKKSGQLTLVLRSEYLLNHYLKGYMN